MDHRKTVRTYYLLLLTIGCNRGRGDQQAVAGAVGESPRLTLIVEIGEVDLVDPVTRAELRVSR